MVGNNGVWPTLSLSVRGCRQPSARRHRDAGRKGWDPRSQVSVVFTDPSIHPPRHLLRAMAETLEGNLQRTLREDLGGTYGVSVSPDFQQSPRPMYRVTISFACDPARLDALVSALFRDIDDFKRRGPSVGQVADQRLALVRDLETNSNSNSYLLNQLTYKYEYGEDPGEVFRLAEFYERITPAAVRSGAECWDPHDMSA